MSAPSERTISKAKQKAEPKGSADYLERITGLGLARTARSVFLGRERPPEVRSVPIPLRAPHYSYKAKKQSQKALLITWSGLRGSNPPPRPWQGRALPNELNPQILNYGDSDGARFAARTARLGRRRL